MYSSINQENIANAPAIAPMIGLLVPCFEALQKFKMDAIQGTFAMY